MYLNTMKHNTTAHSRIREWVTFFFVAMGIITLTLGFFTLIDFLPEKPVDDTTSEVVDDATYDASKKSNSDIVSMQSSEAYPERIVIDALDKTIPVLNPETNDVATLDTALLSGAVRHPDSANFQKTGTMFILGHSSYLPVVHNKNFQAFNGIQKLVWGDTIRLFSKDMEYIYTVDKVYEAKAADARVPLQYEEAKLVLATCNSFGTKDDRYIVEASLVAKRPVVDSGK